MKYRQNSYYHEGHEGNEAEHNSIQIRLMYFMIFQSYNELIEPWEHNWTFRILNLHFLHDLHGEQEGLSTFTKIWICIAMGKMPMVRRDFFLKIPHVFLNWLFESSTLHSPLLSNNSEGGMFFGALHMCLSVEGATTSELIYKRVVRRLSPVYPTLH